jgi:hypothetical protein
MGDILSCEGSVFCFSCLGKEIRERFVDQENVTNLSVFMGLIFRRLVVPMLEVFIYGGFLCGLVFLHHCAETSLSIGRILVHCFVEICISGVVLLFQLNGSHFESK